MLHLAVMLDPNQQLAIAAPRLDKQGVYIDFSGAHMHGTYRFIYTFFYCR